MSKSEGSAKASELPTTAAAVPTTVTDPNSNTFTAAAHSAAVANVSGVVAPAAAPVPAAAPAVMSYNMRVRMRILENTNIFPDLANLIVEYVQFSGEERLTVRGHTGVVRCTAVFPNGCFCSGSDDNSIKIWNRDGQCLQTLKGK